MKVKIYTAENEIDASITKGYLESTDIPATIAPSNSSLGLNPQVNRGPVKSFDVFVEGDKAEEAKKLLEERELTK